MLFQNLNIPDDAWTYADGVCDGSRLRFVITINEYLLFCLEAFEVVINPLDSLANEMNGSQEPCPTMPAAHIEQWHGLTDLFEISTTLTIFKREYAIFGHTLSVN